ncbi:MAG: alpha-ketoglutarate-dependent dioxygenase AlkB [Myxococcales bacterium FL481]|nr:MAG: alpha-ketoglutarate-dependent dioxygenase AlkB [Myxococcales bacterium FL481]
MAPPTPVLQADLFARGSPRVTRDDHAQRIWLDEASWYDVRRRFVRGADALFHELCGRLAWRAATRRMYDRMVDVPRLTADLRSASAELPAIVGDIGDVVSQLYGVPLRLDLAAYYRDGRDSVAWHADRVDLSRPEHTSAIVSLGGPRRLCIRPKGGGRSHAITLASGDALVLGGAIQHRFEHCVPKVRRAPARISLLAFGAFADEPPPEHYRFVQSPAVPSAASAVGLGDGARRARSGRAGERPAAGDPSSV